MSIVVYNPASICSVVAAAYYIDHNRKHNEKVLKAYPAGNKIPMDADLNIWIGVEPTVQHVKQMPGKHLGYFMNPSRSKQLQKLMTIYYPRHSGTGALWLEAMQMLPDSVFKAVLDNNHAVVTDTESKEQVNPLPQWYIAKIAAEFEAGHNLAIEDQALVWINYQDSLMYLNELTDTYEFTGYPSGIGIEGKPIHQPIVAEEILSSIIRNYLDHLRVLKQQITMIFEASILTIGGEAKRVPLINVDQTQAPFILRLLSHSYDYAVTYVQRRGVNIYTTFSRIAGFDEVLLKAVNTSGQKPQAMMSYQL